MKYKIEWKAKSGSLWQEHSTKPFTIKEMANIKVQQLKSKHSAFDFRIKEIEQ